jgi:hypothetical protein
MVLEQQQDFDVYTTLRHMSPFTLYVDTAKTDHPSHAETATGG